jgi:hypothetical protein
MTNQDILRDTVLRAKCSAAYTGESLIQQEKAGENITCCVKKLTLLVRWIEILETYNCQRYETTTEGKFQCLTEAEAMALVAKVKSFIS